MEEIKTNNVFLDTSIFIQENFFAGRKLKAFLKHAACSDIKLLITPITIKETLANIESFSHQANSTLKKGLKEFDNKSKIFKNIPLFDDLFSLQDNYDLDKEIEKLKNQFNEQIDKYFDIIHINKEITSKVIDDYFQFKPPFSDGKKKHEFPDAFVLNSLEKWCEKKHEKIYVVASDQDLLSFDSKHLIPISEYDKLLGQISFTFSDSNMHPKVTALIEEKEDEIKERIEQDFIDDFPSLGYDSNQGFEYEIQDFTEIESFIDHHYVLYFFDNTATVELTVLVKFTADTIFEDTSSGWFDKEDDRWHNTDRLNEYISDEVTLKVMIEVTIELPGKPVDHEEWEFKEIASGIPMNLAI